MHQQYHTEQFSVRRRSGERFVALAVCPDLLTSPRDVSNSGSEEQNLSTSIPNITTDRGESTGTVKAIHILPSLIVVTERASHDDSWSSDIVCLKPCPGGFMVPRVIGRSYTRVTKLLWNNVTWIGLARKRRTVSCLVTITKYDVCLGEVGEGGDLAEICREEFKAPAMDCTFQPWVPRAIYISRDGAGEIYFSFESHIKTTRHIYHPALHGNRDTRGSAAHQGEQHPATPALTCIGLINERNRVLVGDNRGLIYIYGGGARRSFTRLRQLTFPFPLAKLVITAERNSTYLAGLAATSEAAPSRPIVAKARTPSSTAATTNSTSGAKRNALTKGKTLKSPRKERYRDISYTSSTNAGILKVDLGLASPPVYQALGQGRVLGVAWNHDSEHRLLTTVEEKFGMVHHKIHEDKENSPAQAFAAKPVDMLSGEVVWGRGGWLAYITKDEVLLEREPAILTPSDE